MKLSSQLSCSSLSFLRAFSTPRKRRNRRAKREAVKGCRSVGIACPCMPTSARHRTISRPKNWTSWRSISISSRSRKTRRAGNTAARRRASPWRPEEIKKRNPRAKVLFYWNASLDTSSGRGDYLAKQTFPADGFLKDDQGDPVLRRKTVPNYDLTRKDVRDWWSDAAAKAVNKYGADGIFADAMGQSHRARDWTRRKVLRSGRAGCLAGGNAPQDRPRQAHRLQRADER